MPQRKDQNHDINTISRNGRVSAVFQIPGIGLRLIGLQRFTARGAAAGDAGQALFPLGEVAFQTAAGDGLAGFFPLQFAHHVLHIRHMVAGGLPGGFRISGNDRVIDGAVLAQQDIPRPCRLYSCRRL